VLPLTQICPMSIDLVRAQEALQAHYSQNQSTLTPTQLYDPRNYIMGMDGKRLRAIFCLIGYSLYRPDWERALDLAYAIDLFHNFTLVHDDIMDDGTLRRGQETVHLKYGTNAAILTGDVMLIEVYERILSIPHPARHEIAQFFTKIARDVCNGQSMDMSFETADEVTIQDYLKMIELKTAVLLGGALAMGAMLADASTKDCEHLYRFGANAGVSFQIQDDYLDVYGDPTTFGKKVGGDIIQGKKTYLYLRAILLLEDEAAPFKKLYTSTGIDDKIDRVRAVFDELYLSNYCTEAKEGFFQLASSHLNEVNVDPAEKESLLTFARGLMDRSK